MVLCCHGSIVCLTDGAKDFLNLAIISRCWVAFWIKVGVAVIVCTRAVAVNNFPRMISSRALSFHYNGVCSQRQT